MVSLSKIILFKNLNITENFWINFRIGLTKHKLNLVCYVVKIYSLLVKFLHW